MTGHTGGATDVAFLADGVTLVATDRKGGIHFWDLPTARRLAESQAGHQGASWRIAIHPDGQRFATAGDDGQVRSEEHTSELQSLMRISYAVFCLQKKIIHITPLLIGVTYMILKTCREN